MFPKNDKFWEDVRIFIDSNKDTKDIIVGPVEFFEVIPSVIPDFIVKYDKGIKIGEEQLLIDWFIIHKGRLDQINFGVLNIIKSSSRPVFANEVFVVFSRHENLQEIDKNITHYDAFIKRMSAIEIERNNLDIRKEIKNVIMVSIDNLRFDCVGYQPDKEELVRYNVLSLLDTKNIDNIASKSICFTQAISTAPYTTASHASIFTGLYPPRHGIRAFLYTKLSENVLTLAEIFQKEGYMTILATDFLELWEPLDLHRGFSNIFIRDDKNLLEFLDKNKKEKIFLFIHFYDVHEPFMLSEYGMFDNSDYYEILERLCKEYNVEFEKEKPHTTWKRLANDTFKRDANLLFPLYVKGVNKFDSGRFKECIDNIKDLGFMENSLMIIFSDHGEGRASVRPNYFAHHGAVYDGVIRVPLMIYFEGINSRTIDNQVSTVDIFPTILDICNISISYSIDGRSLVPLMEGKDLSDSISYSEVWLIDQGGHLLDDPTDNPDSRNSQWIIFQRCVRTKKNKYIIYGKSENLDDPSFTACDTDDFLRNIYRCLLSRFETDDELKYYANIINKFNIPLYEFLHVFLQSSEYKGANEFVMYDLINDRHEENPILMRHYLYESFIFGLERQAVATKKIFSQETEDEKKIKDRLKSLGYLD